MTDVVYKYDISADDRQNIELPKGSAILRIDEQHNGLKLWALHDAETEDKEDWQIRLAGTGHAIQTGDLKFINTFFMQDKAFVFHAFARKI